jgi:XisI protein
METTTRQRAAIIQVLSELAEMSNQGQESETLPLFDTERDNYALISTGWRGIQRLHHITAHMRIANGKVWVEADNTNVELVQQLLDLGIRKDEIVLAFYSRKKRPFTEFAVE